MSGETPEAEQSATNEEFESFLLYLSTSRGFDFTGYKRGSLARRVHKRMEGVGIRAFAEYTDYLEVHPDEFTELFNTILINVTSFFRDPAAWQRIAAEVIPAIIEPKGPHGDIRIWTAGCSSGEEAYTLAMLFAEALGPDAFRDRVKIYATDVDEDELNIARRAVYSADALNAIPDPEMRSRYFEPANGGYAFRKDLRRGLIFGRHDLLQDAPISRVDLLTCRNTLMYLNSEAQARVIARFLFALNESGYLFLGKAETLLSRTPALTPIDLKLRIFSKLAGGGSGEHAVAQPDWSYNTAGGARDEHVRDVAFEVDPVPALIVDDAGRLSAANERARQLFALRSRDIGRPLQDLELSYSPLEIRSLIAQVHQDRKAVVVPELPWPNGGRSPRWFSVQILPLIDGSANLIGVQISFFDITRSKQLEAEVEEARTQLQSTNEELETTNEELQSTIEELETTNEELQSTNEELETMNEELQSTNEELETVNNETRTYGEDVRHANALLQTALSTLRISVIAVRPDFEVQFWNQQSEELWGLRESEVVGKQLLNLDMGLPVAELAAPMRQALADPGAHFEMTIEATNRRGKHVRLWTRIAPLSFNSAVNSVVLLMEEIPE